MRLATYNIWNSPAGMPLRFAQIVNEILNLDTDIICLQEVADVGMNDQIALQPGFSDLRDEVPINA